jgi:hypothetical protein
LNAIDGSQWWIRVQPTLPLLRAKRARRLRLEKMM